MMSATRLLLVSMIVLAGCHTAHDVAVTSFHVIDAPAKYVRDHIDQNETTTTTTTTTNVSDVATPGRAVSSPPPKVVHHDTATPRPHNEVASSTPKKSSATPTPRPAATQTAQFPTAKPVPGKPGYVYSVDPKGGIVDVTGYKSGDKAKDPYTKQIFIVP
jgi:hypothetical protein